MDYKETAFNASQMLTQLASFARQNKGISLGFSEKELAEQAEALMRDVRELYKKV